MKYTKVMIVSALLVLAASQAWSSTKMTVSVSLGGSAQTAAKKFQTSFFRDISNVHCADVISSDSVPFTTPIPINGPINFVIETNASGACATEDSVFTLNFRYATPAEGYDSDLPPLYTQSFIKPWYNAVSWAPDGAPSAAPSPWSVPDVGMGADEYTALITGNGET